MRRRTLTAFGAGATVTVAATAVLTTGLLGPSVPLVGAGPAAADELVAFDGCEELRRWYVDAALPRVGPYGLDAGWFTALSGAELSGRETAVDVDSGAVADARRRTGDAVGSGATGTNVQEAGVDEPDRAKTDGSVVAEVTDRALTLTDVTGSAPRRLSTRRLPEALTGAELLWVGDRLVLLSSGLGYWGGPMPLEGLVEDSRIAPQGDGSTTTLVVDVADPTAPRLQEETTYGGRLLSARQYGDVVRIVLSTDRPTIDFVQPDRSRTPAQATRENRRRLRQSRIESWLPTVATGTGAQGPLLECEDVQHPEESAGYGTVSVVAFRPTDAATRVTTAVTATSDLVYSSTDRLYLATSPGTDWGLPLPVDAARGAVPRTTVPAHTAVHAFTLEGTSTSYTASGEVPGRVRDRWSFSEYDGHLRVATALGEDTWEPRENAVVVLRERGEALVEVGRVGGMGLREQIQSVRWFDDLAIVVTFRQTDPLYTVDLADPTAPRVAGELKIPGFSAYLHPVGGDLLVGLGQDADLRGTTRGAQAGTFDVSSLAAPRQVDTEHFGRASTFVAQWESRAFTYLPGERLVLAPLQAPNQGTTRLVVLEVGEDGSLTRRSAASVAGWDSTSVRTLPLEDGRVAVVAGATVTLLDVSR